MKKTTKKNSTTRKLLPAFAMLAVSAVTLSTSTYAWFSMNKTVNVTGMQLTAKSNSKYLIIGESSNAATLQATSGGNLTTLAYTGNSATLEVYPSQHNPGGANDSVVVAGSAKVTNTETAIDPGNWYYKIASSPTASTAKANSEVALTSDNFTDYVLHKQFYVTLAAGSQSASDLKLQSATFTTTNVKTGSSETMNAVTVLVTSANAYDEVAADSDTPAGTVLASTVTDSAAIPIDVFIFYDGDDASVYTNNLANLEGASVELVFEVDGGV